MFLNFGIPKYCINTFIITINSSYCREMSLKDTETLAHSADPDQTAPLGAV